MLVAAPPFSGLGREGCGDSRDRDSENPECGGWKDGEANVRPVGRLKMRWSPKVAITGKCSGKSLA